MTTINNVIDMLNYNHGISVREHLHFGNYNHSTSLLGLLGLGNSKLKFTEKYGSKFIGELNSKNKLQGKGIAIYPSGFIEIGYFEKGYLAPGNYLWIYSDGKFHVGERYLKDGKRWDKYTQYLTNGKQIKFDKAF